MPFYILNVYTNNQISKFFNLQWIATVKDTVLIIMATLTVAAGHRLLVTMEAGHDLIVSVVIRYEERTNIWVDVVYEMLVAFEVENKHQMIPKLIGNVTYFHAYLCNWLQTAIVKWGFNLALDLQVGIHELVLNVETSAGMHDVTGSVVRLK